MSNSLASTRSWSPSARLRNCNSSAPMRVTVATQLADGLRQIVDLGTDRIALGDDVARQRVEGDGPIELFESHPAGGGGQRAAHRVGVGAQQTDIDHRSERLPVLSG